MKKSVLLVAYVDEGGVKARHQLLDLCQVDVADGIGNVSRLLLQGDETRILQQGNGYLCGLYVDNQFTFHLIPWGDGECGSESLSPGFGLVLGV